MSLAYSDSDFLTFRSARRPLIEHSESVTEPVNVVDWSDATKVAAPALPAWLGPVLARMLELQLLKNNWDGRRSAAIRREVLTFSLEMLSGVMMSTTAPPSIIPLGHGGIQLIWSSDQYELEIEVAAPPEVLIYFHNKGEDIEREFRAGTDYSELAELLKVMFTR
jgi:hypothetical protein